MITDAYFRLQLDYARVNLLLIVLCFVGGSLLCLSFFMYLVVSTVSSDCLVVGLWSDL